MKNNFITYLFISFFMFTNKSFSQPITNTSQERIIGQFEIEININQRVFKDYLTVKKNKDGEFYGDFVVPGSFSSKVYNLEYSDSEGLYSFEIIVSEGNQNYKALFIGVFINHDQFSGKAYVLPQRSLIGEYLGKRIKK